MIKRKKRRDNVKRESEPVNTRLTIREAEELLRVDRNNIDEELERHPTILAEVGSMRVTAEAQRDTAKDAMFQEEARAYLDAKDDAEAKATDNSIKQEAKLDKKVIAAQAKYRSAKAEAAQWEVLWSAFGQRSFMLNKLAELYTAQFYSPDSYERPKIDRKKSRQ